MTRDDTLGGMVWLKKETSCCWGKPKITVHSISSDEASTPRFEVLPKLIPSGKETLVLTNGPTGSGCLCCATKLEPTLYDEERSVTFKKPFPTEPSCFGLCGGDDQAKVVIYGDGYTTPVTVKNETKGNCCFGTDVSIPTGPPGKYKVVLASAPTCKDKVTECLPLCPPKCLKEKFVCFRFKCPDFLACCKPQVELKIINAGGESVGKMSFFTSDDIITIRFPDGATHMDKKNLIGAALLFDNPSMPPSAKSKGAVGPFKL